jgi:hypothetical protein
MKSMKYKIQTLSEHQAWNDTLSQVNSSVQRQIKAQAMRIVHDQIRNQILDQTLIFVK